MNYVKSVTVGSLVSLLVFSPTASAQVTPAPFGGRGDISEQEIYYPPEAYVLNASATVAEDNTVNGTITFWNKSDDILGDMAYSIDLLGELPATTTENPVVEDNSPVYDTVSSAESFVLLAGEKKDIPFTYNPPKNLPGGNYRLQITIGTSRGRTMGWFDVPVRFNGEKSAYIKLFPKDIATPEYKDKTFGPETGPNINASQNISLSAIAVSETPLLLAPVLDIHTFSPSRPLLRSVRGSSITANQEGTALSITVPTFKEPGVYVGILSLRDPITNERVSNLAKYRWVVRGKDADILHARMTTFGSKKNDIISFSIDYVGAGDAETKTNGSIVLELRDEAGSLEKHSVPDIALDDSIRTGTTDFVLNRNLVGSPTLDISLLAENGAILTTHSVAFPFQADQLRALERSKIISRFLLLVGALLVLIGAAMLARLYLRKKRKK